MVAFVAEYTMQAMFDKYEFVKLEMVSIDEWGVSGRGTAD